MSVQTSNDATLSGLSLSDGTLSPSFSPTQPDYTATVVDTVVRVTVTPVTNHAGATVAYLDADDMPLADADPASADTFEFDLAVGDTVVKVKVTADDGAATQIYTATVTRQASTDATLSGLSLSNGTLSPNFSREHTDYTATVGNTGPQIITVTPVTNHAGATVAYLDADDVPLADADTASADTFEVDLTVGANVVKVKVTAENGTATKTYTVTVTRQASNDATLSGLYLGDGTLSPGFSPTRTDYTATVGNTVVRVTVTPVTNHAGATVAYLDADDMPLADADTASADTFEVDLTVGDTVVKVKVTAENGTAMKTYTVTVTRQGSNDATLSGLSLSNGTLSPMFSSTQPDYTATVGNTGPQIITVTPVTNHAGATVAYLDADDVPLADADTASADTFEVDLTVGANVVKVKVTAENGTATKTYTVTVTRQASNDATLSGLSLSDGTLSPAFSREHTSYAATVVDTVVRVTVTPVTNHAGATIAYLDADDMALADADTASADAFEVDLAVGDTVVKVKVTAEDSAATKTYTVTVTRQASTDATLSGLSLSGGTLSPNFSPTHTDYAGTVEGMVSRVTVTPVTNHPSATLEYLDADDMALADADTASADTFEVDLPVRANVVKVKVTAENGTATKTYTVTVTRPASNDATLSGLSLGNGTLSPAFSPEHTSYAATVVDTVVRVTVTPVTNHAGAAVAYLDADDMALADADTASADTFEVDLAVGANVVKVKVTAENGTAMKTYTVTVTRQASNDATLSGLSLSNGTLSPMFSSTQPDYTATVGNTGPQIITVTPATNHAGATVAYLDADDVPLADADTASADTFEVDLTVGETVVKVKVTAEDGTATQTYTVTITRDASNDATLSGLSLSDGTLSPAFSREHTSYTATVGNTVVRVTVTPETNHAGATVAYLDADDEALVDADTSSTDTFEVDLPVGDTVVKVKVTAEDSAATKTYTVTVTRPASTDATLSGLSLSGGTLSPNFSPTHTDYAGTVEGMVSRVTVTPVTNHPSATLEYLDADDMALADADATSADTFEVDLADNETVFKVTVTAEDDAATKTYIVTVTRVSLRLRNGTGAHEGRVEIFQQGQWGTICDDDWTDVEAGVVCRSLGFALGAVDNLGRTQDAQGRSLPPLYFGPAAAGVKMWLDNVNCKGNETNLLDCPRRGNTAVGVHNCKPNEAVGVQCRIVPKVKSVAVSPASGPYAAGGTLRVTVEWNQPVVVTTPAGGSAPKLMVGYDTGGVIEERDAVYASGSGTAALVFEHTLAGGDSFESVTVVSDSVQVRDGAIVWKTDRGVDADPALAPMTSQQLEAPVVVAVPVVEGAPAVGEPVGEAWTAGETVEVQLTFSEPVTVGITGTDGRPSIGLWLGGTQARSAAYASGSETKELVFGYTLLEADGPHSMMWVPPDSLALNGGTIVSTADGTVDAALAHEGAAKSVVAVPRDEEGGSTVRDVADGPTARFSDVPATHDGATAFEVKLSFSAAPGLDEETVRDALEVSCATQSCATVTGASRVTDREWTVTVAPSQAYAITLTLPVRACGETGAVCIGKRTLAGPASATIPGRALTATLTHLPDEGDVRGEHKGSGTFEVRLVFNTEPHVSYKTVRDTMFDVTGGTITGARRVRTSHDKEFDIVVKPSGSGAVTFSLASPLPACGETGSVCTEAGRMIEGPVSATVLGPVAISVADASVTEGADAVLAFEVTLDRARSAPVTVDYTTRDGEATAAGRDYVETSGRLTFAAGETLKTVNVDVLEDSHDEGTETMRLELLNASGARIADGTAIGTIENSDPMPMAWMVRFGRTVASQVVDALGQRLEGGQASHVTVAGVPLTGGAAPVPEDKADDAFGLPAWAKDAQREEEARTITADDLLLRSEFHLSSGSREAGGRAFTTWGRVGTGGFDAEVDDVTMDGDVTTGLLGFDAEWDNLLAGVMLTQSAGEGAYRLDPEQGSDAGTVKSDLTGVYPYARINLDARVSAWALAGAGSGSITLTQDGRDAMKTDLSMRMGALGVKGQVLDGTGPSGMRLDLKSDAMWVGTKSARSADMVGTQGDVTRLRLVAQGERDFALAEQGALTPSAELGLRHDGGDAETGMGVELGAGLRYMAGSFTIEAQARTLVAHEASGYEEWGVSAAVRLTPSASGRGLSLSVAPTWGRTGSASEQLWSARDAGDLAGGGGFEADGRIEAQLGYGLALPRNRGLLTPYGALTLGSEGGRTMRGGARWMLDSDLAVTLDATRNESADTDADNEVRVQAALRF